MIKKKKTELKLNVIEVQMGAPTTSPAGIACT